MIVGLGVELLDRARFEVALNAARAARVGGVSLTLTHDPTCCVGQVVLEARE
jgi:phosphopantetheinyl transferase (holo-ACP synthase)